MKLKSAIYVFVMMSYAIIFYGIIGDYQQVYQYYVEKSLNTDKEKMLAELRSPYDLIIKMQKQLEKDPDNSKGWYLLGRIYQMQQLWQEAAAAFEKSHTLKKSTDTTFQLALTYYQIDKQVLSKRVDKLLLSITKDDPANMNVLAFYAEDARVKGDIKRSLTYWKKLQSTQTDPALIQQLNEIIGKLEKQVNHDLVTIFIKVEIDPHYKNSLPPTTIIYVFAKALKGPTFPLAVKRYALSDLPSIVELSENDSMQSGYSIAEFQDLVISAKISLDGVATSHDNVKMVRKIIHRKLPSHLYTLKLP